MLRLAKFRSGDHQGQVAHWFEARGEKKLIVSLEGKSEYDSFTWLDGGKRRGTVKGSVEDISEMFEDYFGKTLRVEKEEVLVADWESALEDEEKGTKNCIWHKLNSLSESMLRKTYKTNELMLVKRYKVLDPESESYENHIDDACENSEGIPSWIDIETGNVKYALERPGDDYYRYYCEMRIRRTDIEEPYYCFGDPELSEKFVAFCKLQGAPVDNTNPDDKKEPEEQPKTASRRNRKNEIFANE